VLSSCLRSTSALDLLANGIGSSLDTDRNLVETA
jgi:hypothetical protein